jgi:hypothetical protein
MHGVEIGGGGCGSMFGMNGGGFVVEELSPCSWRCLACCLLRLVLLLSLLAVLSISGSKRSSSTGICPRIKRKLHTKPNKLQAQVKNSKAKN